MSNQGFTPGPWVVQRAADAYCIASVGNLVIMPSSGKVKHDNTEADAQLIAAAPELLDALTQCRAELLSMIDKHNKQDADDGSWLYDYQTVVEADAAIAKARGTPC